MKKLCIIPIVALALAGCGESVGQIDDHLVMVSDNDGKIDQRQVREACPTIGQSFVRQPTSVSVGEGQLVVVKCR